MSTIVEGVSAEAPGLEYLPFDLALRCVALLPIAEGPCYRRASRRLSALGGTDLSRTRSRLGVRELRLLGVVAADPRHRNRQTRCEAARLSLALQPQATSEAKELLQIKGSQLEAMLDGVDRAASCLETSASGKETYSEQSILQCSPTDNAKTISHSSLHQWDSMGCMREMETYAVVDGKLYVIGPPDLCNFRWMMHMNDADKNFGQMQNARLYVSNVDAEFSRATASADSCVLQTSQEILSGKASRFSTQNCTTQHKCAKKPDTLSYGTAKGIRGRLLFCALEL